MNEWDKDNLDFIMKSNETEFQCWLEQADSDDIDYAMDLLRQSKMILTEQMASLFDDVGDCKEANEVINRIKSK